MPHSTENRSRGWARRALSAFLALVLLVGIVPASVLPASAAHWADEYLNQLVDWGFMRADQIGNPDAAVTAHQPGPVCSHHQPGLRLQRDGPHPLCRCAPDRVVL